MKKTIRAMALLVVIALMGLSMTGCEWLLEEALTSISGTVVDGRTGGGTTDPDGVAGVAVTLTPVNGGSALTATTDTNGYFSVDYENEGVYRLTASKSGWFFVPQDVNISGWLGTTSDVIGIETGGSKGLDSAVSGALTFVVVWNDSYEDIDAHLTYTDGDGSGNAASVSYAIATSFSDPYEPYSTSGGFGPTSLGVNREDVGPGGVNYSPTTVPVSHSDNTIGDVLLTAETGYAVQQDRDDRDGAGPEVITVNSIPFWPSSVGSTFITGNATNKLPTTKTWVWTSVMELYIDGWNSTSSTAARGTDDYLDGTGATVYAVVGSNLLGSFPIPSDINAQTLSIVRINTFVSSDENESYFQLVPDIKIVDGDPDDDGDVELSSTSGSVLGFSGPGRSR